LTTYLSGRSMQSRWTLVVAGCLVASLMACASSAPRPLAMTSEEQLRCAGVSDSVSKYVSEDALPLAHLVGSPRTLPVPASIRPGDSVAVDFVVGQDGVADTSTVVIVGADDPQFARSAMQFATGSRFTPARISNCYVLSRYNLIVKARP
jgi:hypothetical protein